MNLAAPKLQRPNFAVLPLANALADAWSGWHLSKKADGVCVRREWNDCAVWGDSMRDGRLMVWEIDRAFGADVRALPWRGGRADALAELFAHLDPKLNWHRCPSGHGPEFVEAMLAEARRDHTPDVIVAKPLEAPFGRDLIKAKICDSHDCAVLEIHAEKESVRLGQFDAAGQLIERGWCAVLGGDWGNRRVDQLTPGDMVEIHCAGIHASGKFREPRFFQPRPDKPAAF